MFKLNYKVFSFAVPALIAAIVFCSASACARRTSAAVPEPKAFASSFNQNAEEDLSQPIVVDLQLSLAIADFVRESADETRGVVSGISVEILPAETICRVRVSAGNGQTHEFTRRWTLAESDALFAGRSVKQMNAAFRKTGNRPETTAAFYRDALWTITDESAGGEFDELNLTIEKKADGGFTYGGYTREGGEINRFTMRQARNSRLKFYSAPVYEDNAQIAILKY